jgi:hypothetical protein
MLITESSSAGASWAGWGQSKAGEGARSTVDPLPREGRALTRLTLTRTAGKAPFRPRARVKLVFTGDLLGMS